MLKDLMWKVYNAQGSGGGDAEAMAEAMGPLTVPGRMREQLCSHIASKGFVSPRYIEACMQAALDFLGGTLRAVGEYGAEGMPPMPDWNDYAVYVQGAKLDP